LSLTFFGSEAMQVDYRYLGLRIFGCMLFGLLVAGITWIAAGA
jgi:hypothetical protein